MAYELTSAAATTGNPYAIVGAAIVDTIRATARTSTTSKGTGISQNQLSADQFAGYITDAIGQSFGQSRGTSASIGRANASPELPGGLLGNVIRAVGFNPSSGAPSEETPSAAVSTRKAVPNSAAAELFNRALTQRGSGVYAQITAPTISANNDSTTTKRSIVCTTLMNLGEIHWAVYGAGIPHWESRSRRMISGYHKWGFRVAALCEKNWLVRKVCGKIARARYHYILFNQWNFLGWLTVAVGERICYMIGDKNAIN